MISITYFVHGTTEDNEQGLASGWADARLSPKGVEQAKALPQLAAAARFDMVFTSDLQRAVDTAASAFPDSPRHADQRLRECNYGLLTRTANKALEAASHGYINTPFPGGESYTDVENRLRSFLADIAAPFQGKGIAIVAHRAPQLALDVLLRDKTWEQAFREDWRRSGGEGWRPGWPYLFYPERLLRQPA